VLTDDEVERFIADGYVAVRRAFDGRVAAACRERIWRELEARGIRRADPTTWTAAVVDLRCPDGEEFSAAGQAAPLCEAYDRLIGPKRWRRREGVGGSVMARFPSEAHPGDTGYHIDGNWWGGDEFWTNVRSRGRGLLALFLFGDVGDDDAPTRLVCGSHLAIPSILAPAGEAGMGGSAAASRLRPSVLCRRVVHATGSAGDVFLCHPFLVHTPTWPHRGAAPRFMAQPEIAAPDGFAIDGADPSPVAQAIVRGLREDPPKASPET
jgi:hypothetical protein